MTITADRSSTDNNPEEGKTVKIVADKHKCIGAGTCVVIAPELFDQDDEGIVDVLVEEPREDQLGVLNEAIEYCPAQALLLARD
jgi:ferredoxin